MGEHTKGPWSIGEQWTIGASIMATTKNPQDTHIATVHGSTFAGLVSNTAMDANASLIAAAPELLEALERVTETLDAVQVPFPDGFDLRIAEALEAARAAIEKARGG